MRPLLIAGEEGTVEACCDIVVIKHLTGKFHGHLIRTIRSTRPAQHATAHSLGHGVIHHPEIETNVVPTKIAETTQRLKVTVHADITGKKILACVEAK